MFGLTTERTLKVYREIVDNADKAIADLEREKDSLVQQVDDALGTLTQANLAVRNAESTILGLRDDIETLRLALAEGKDPAGEMYQRVFIELARRKATLEMAYYPSQPVGQTVRYTISFVPSLTTIDGSSFGITPAERQVITDIAKRFYKSSKWSCQGTLFTQRGYDLNDALIHEMNALETELQKHLTRYLQVEAYSAISKEVQA